MNATAKPPASPAVVVDITARQLVVPTNVTTEDMGIWPSTMDAPGHFRPSFIMAIERRDLCMKFCTVNKWLC